MSHLPFALVGASLSEQCKQSLASCGFHIISLPPYSRLSLSVQAHTDLLCFVLDRKVFTYGDYIKESGIEVTFRATECDMIEISDIPESLYPKDIYLNGLVVGHRIFGRLDCLSGEIRSYAEAAGYELINTKQGYARCGALPVSDNAIVTADPSISRAAELCGIEVLRISEGGVRLSGYDYGFIGGAGGAFGDRVFFAGDLFLHPDGEKIADFCLAHGKTAVCLSHEPLYDVGSVLFLA